MNIKSFIMMTASVFTLTACGYQCDDYINGMCIVYNGLDVNKEGVIKGAALAEEAWSNRFGEVNLTSLATEYGLIVFYEDESIFENNTDTGYFYWNEDQSIRPEVHVAYRSTFNDDRRCMTGWNLGHDIMHLFAVVVGDGYHDHRNKEIWLTAAGKYGYKSTVEYEIYLGMSEFCGIERD